MTSTATPITRSCKIPSFAPPSSLPSLTPAPRYNRKRIKFFDDRDFLSRCIWSETDYGFLMVTDPIETMRRPQLPKTVRGKYPSALKITKLDEGHCRLEYVINPDFGGRVPGT